MTKVDKKTIIIKKRNTIFFRPNLIKKNIEIEKKVITDVVFSPVIITPISNIIVIKKNKVKFSLYLYEIKHNEINPNLNKYIPGINSSSNGPESLWACFWKPKIS